MSRNYPNFLDAYMDYARDGFVPDKFHFWTGVSIIAGALERKIWMPLGTKSSLYPNMYILLVSHPGVGKSSAINPGVDLLRKVSAHSNAHINFIPSQVTEAKLIELMANGNFFTHGTKQVRHCSGYYIASEASACLRDLYGNFIATITAFYDCDNVWSKATVGMGEGKELTLTNVCFNLLAGSTFDYLATLLSGSSIQGGFASRVLYVIQRDVIERTPVWSNSGSSPEHTALKDGLLSDLFDIHQMVGEVTATAEYVAEWSKWWVSNDKERQALKSENLQAILARKDPNVRKLSMILSAAEASDKTLRVRHFEQALALVNELQKEIPHMLRSGQAKETTTQNGINQMLFKLLANGANGEIEQNVAITKLMLSGFDKRTAQSTIQGFAAKGGPIELRNSTLHLVGDPNDYL